MNVLVIGSGGYWGSKLVDHLESLIPGRIFRCDPSKGHPELGYTNYTEMLAGIDAIDAVVIATPSTTHYEITKLCLNANKHVLVEKPMTLDYAQACELVELAESKKLTLMVDDTFMYTNFMLYAARRFPNSTGIRTYPSASLNLYWTGKRYGNAPESVLWTYGPHPVSVALAMVHEQPTRVYASGNETRLEIDLDFFGTTAHICLDTNSLARKRHLFMHEWQHVRFVDFMSPNAMMYEHRDPLTNMLRAFLRRAESKSEPWIDYHSLEVVRVLEEIEKSCKSH